MKQSDSLENDPFYVFKPKNYEAIPIFCPVCEFTMRSFEDVLSFKDSKCCFECETFFVKSNIQIDKSSQKYSEYIAKRLQRSSFSFNFK